MKELEAWIASFGDYALDSALPALFWLIVGMVGVQLVLRIVRKALQKTNLEKASHTLIRSVIRITLYVLLSLIVAEKLGIDVTSVVALASVLTLAVSLSLQNALTNVISGFNLLYTKPFVSADYVEIAGQSGTVVEIGLAYTKLATPDNKMISIPNSSVVSAEIVNYTATGTRRVEIEVSASYDSAVDQVLDALRQAGDVPARLEENEPFAAVAGYGESAINYVLHVWTKTEDFWTTKFSVNENIKKIFDEKGIIMTYPHLNVHLDK